MKIRAHETFYMRKGWLHKGIKNINTNPRLFTNKEINPCDVLGIGTNMVKSLRYWMNAVGIMEEFSEGNQHMQRMTQFGKIINQYDEYYEEDGTNWLIHYKVADKIRQIAEEVQYGDYNVYPQLKELDARIEATADGIADALSPEEMLNAATKLERLVAERKEKLLYIKKLRG